MRYYILLDREWGWREEVAILKAGVTPADVIEWYTTWKPTTPKGWLVGPDWTLWGEAFEYTLCCDPHDNGYSTNEYDWYLGEWGRFKDSEGVTHFLWQKPKLQLSWDYDYGTQQDQWLVYGKASFHLNYPEDIWDEWGDFIEDT